LVPGTDFLIDTARSDTSILGMNHSCLAPKSPVAQK
jgi:hypothetical protein